MSSNQEIYYFNPEYITPKQKKLHLKNLLNNSKIYKNNNVTYYKILTNDFIHNNFQFKLGENILKQKFNKDVSCCSEGGFYFCKLEDVCKWLDYKYNLTYICEVQLCKDSIVVDGHDKLKTNKFILKNKLDIGTFLKKHNLEDEAYEIIYNRKYMNRFSFCKKIILPTIIFAIFVIIFLLILIIY
jgi:hypothetical protein